MTCGRDAAAHLRLRRIQLHRRLQQLVAEVHRYARGWLAEDRIHELPHAAHADGSVGNAGRASQRPLDQLHRLRPNAARPQYMYSPAAINMGASPPPYNDASAGLAVQLNTGAGLVNVRSYAVVGGPARLLPRNRSRTQCRGDDTAAEVHLCAQQRVLPPAAVVLPASIVDYPTA